MMMIVLRLLSLLGLKSRWHRHFSPRPLDKVFFQGWVSADSWTLGPKPLCHRHPTGPHPSGLLWTPWTPAGGNSAKSNFALSRAVLDHHHPDLARRRRQPTVRIGGIEAHGDTVLHIAADCLDEPAAHAGDDVAMAHRVVDAPPRRARIGI